MVEIIRFFENEAKLKTMGDWFNEMTNISRTAASAHYTAENMKVRGRPGSYAVQRAHFFRLRAELATARLARLSDIGGIVMNSGGNYESHAGDFSYEEGIKLPWITENESTEEAKQIVADELGKLSDTEKYLKETIPECEFKPLIVQSILTERKRALEAVLEYYKAMEAQKAE